MSKASTDFDDQLEALLAEGPEGARQREAAAIAALGELNGAGIVLFGAGNLGQRTLAGLDRVGIEPLCFVDNNKSLWGKDLNGIPVLSPAEGATHYGNRALFVVTIWRAGGGDRMAARVGQLRQHGCRTVVPFLPLYWKYADSLLPHYMHDLPHRVHAEADRVRQALCLMADDASRREYLAQMRFRLLGDFESLPSPVQGDAYFREELFHLRRDELLVDCGAFDGDTLDLFLKKTAHSFRGAVAFEPDPGELRQARRKSGFPASQSARVHLYASSSNRRYEQERVDGRGKGSGFKNRQCWLRSRVRIIGFHASRRARHYHKNGY